MLSSFATFAVAFLVRPLGGMVFGPMGDKAGRKKVLALTMLLMAIGTAAIGMLPTYAAVGFWSPLLLILFRLLQGFSTGDEYGGASTFIAEYAPDKRRGCFGSFLELGTPAGYTGAAALVTVLTAWLGTDTMDTWGRRVPFLLAGPLGIVGSYLRLKLDDTPAYLKLEEGNVHITEAANPVEITARVEAPSGFSPFCGDIVRPPRAWPERTADLVHMSGPPRGGHFAPLGEPEAYAEESRAFFRPCRTAADRGRDSGSPAGVTGR